MKEYVTKSAHGLTLIEIIIAMSILGLLVSVFLPVIANSFYGIRSAGQINKDLYTVQQAVEIDLLNANTSNSDAQQVISFPSAGINGIQVKVQGELVPPNTSTSHPVSITFFKPLGSKQ